jgi:type II restriction/modification system DNA methylase subunit YeeA
MGKDVFENAIVDTNILIVSNGKSNKIGKAVDMDRLSDKTFPPAESLWGELRMQGEKPWSALSSIEQSIMDKMEAVGTPLKEWDIALNYGIKTGYNAAFVIDNDTKEALIAEDPHSAEIIKPVLRGRDIQRYRAEWAGLWLIDTHNGYGSVPAVDIDEYPAIKNHLDVFYPQLKKRQDKGKTPYNLRNCAYHQVFDEEKLIWMQMTDQGRFAYSEDSIFGNAKVFILTGESLKYLCAVLNSKLPAWFMSNTGVTTGMGLMQWQGVTVQRIPIPRISTASQSPFIRLVDRILEAKSANPKADTEKEEAEIDRLVYDLYGLTEDEIWATTVGY